MVAWSSRLHDPASDALALVARFDFDACQVDLGWAVFDVEHANGYSVGGDDLPPVRGKTVGVVVALVLFVPALDRVDVLTHRGLM